jgi:hypothetical protein
MSGYEAPFDNENLTPTYCTVGQVSRMLGHDSTSGEYFSDTTGADDIDDTFPWADDIKEAILESEQVIDDRIRTSYRPIRVVNEYHTITELWRWGSGIGVPLNHKYVLPLRKSLGDSVQVFNYDKGDTYTEALDSWSEGRGNDFWVNYEEGIIYFYEKWPWQWEKGIKITYRYRLNSTPVYDESGTTVTTVISHVPRSVQRACRYLTAAHLIFQQDTTQFIIDGTDRVALQKKAEWWENKAWEILKPREELLWVRR